MTTKEILARAASVRGRLSLLTNEEKNAALLSMANCLEEDAEKIIAANREDISAARGKISDVMIDRLFLDEKRIFSMAEGVRALVSLDDPVGKVLSTHETPGGLKINKISVPFGVVAIIYESRPNVTSDAAALCLKSSNACVLRSGKEAFLSASAIVSSLRRGLALADLPEDLINLITDTTRESANEIMTATGYVDLLIPRGGAGLIRACVENAKVPCIQTGTGICHVYVDKSADIDMALDIIENAKTSRPSVCNAEEVLLVNADIAEKFLPLLKERLVDKRIAEGKIPVELRLCKRAAEIIGGKEAGENDFDTEFLDYVLAVKIVDNIKEAILHIDSHSTKHSDAIITNDKENAELFTKTVDSAAVYVNASTRFTDGGEFGLGCEMGISTQKLHARGPMGICELTSYKYVILGNGQIR